MDGLAVSVFLSAHDGQLDPDNIWQIEDSNRSSTTSSTASRSAPPPTPATTDDVLGPSRDVTHDIPLLPRYDPTNIHAQWSGTSDTA